ncbi:sigma-70 family RNA polymerase sigma factor [Pseudomonas nitroreducens]|uniref:sigma-70 family RNA polymerase sigma factor n=1 Tax=Pseudomonas nitroreducens TaxID=46680 RepID=UPI001FB5F168|nr:sigma-70 family RNA polymerase sigma factor [Pseudomonas nitroreducens]MCJ1882726.1 sigma-70 family RNA polymerase sigma factor [Pseudomonas nitroreducens]MCJ1898205.1 sigma-70 family RNA polymerase sigma factor [Pseudomonas nitroreducens]
MDSERAFERDVERLYLAHHGWLKGWLRRRLGEHADAEDLAHDTFVRVMRSRSAIADLRQPLAYLATIANSLLINRWRRQAVERAYLEALAARSEAVAPSEEERLLLIEALVEVDELLHGLAPQVREIFLLSQLDGLTYPQIALRLELSVNQVQKAMSKAFAACYASRFE